MYERMYYGYYVVYYFSSRRSMCVSYSTTSTRRVVVVVVVISDDCYSNQPLPASFKTIIYCQLVYNKSRPRKIIIVILASIQI